MLIGLKKNKRGQLTWLILPVLIVLFIAMIGFLVVGIVSSKINDTLNQDIQLGAVNLAEVNAQTFGMFNYMLMRHADWMGVCVIFGLILGLFLSAYITRNRFPKWGLILDIFLIFAIYILALYLKSTYQLILDSFSGIGESFLENSMPKSSMFMLNLPIFTVIIGAIMMILFHSSIPKKEEEANFERNYFPGQY